MDLYEDTVAEDLELETFVECFLNPGDEKSKDYMGDHLEEPYTDVSSIISRQNTIQELSNDEDILDAFRQAYDSISNLRKARRREARFVESKIRRGMDIMSSYRDAVKTLASINPDTTELRGISDKAESYLESPEFNELDRLINNMEEHGETSLTYRENFFGETVEASVQESGDTNPFTNPVRIMKWMLSDLQTYSPLTEFDKNTKYANAIEEIELSNRDGIMNVSNLKEHLDFLNGTVNYIEEMRDRGIPLAYPQIDEFIDYGQLYNPNLLDQENINSVEDMVPNDFTMERGGMEIYTGMNTGGKTIAMKSFGLATLLAQNGLPVTSKKATIRPQNQFLTHFGIEDDISTGKGILEQEGQIAGEIVRMSDEDTLVLLDEPVRGTDIESARVATEQIMRDLSDQNSNSIMTTHLKKVAENLDEFDHVTNRHVATERISDNRVRPLYRLDEGIADETHGEKQFKASYNDARVS